MTKTSIMIQIIIFTLYLVYFYVLGRIYQKKTKMFMNSNISSIFPGFIIFVLATYISFIPIVIFDANIISMFIMNIVKDMILLLFILFHYRDWINDWMFLKSKNNAIKSLVSILSIIITLTAVYFIFEASTVSAPNSDINDYYSGVNNLVLEKTNKFYLDGSNEANPINNLYFLNIFYYWISVIIKMFPSFDIESINRLFLILISTIVLYSVVFTLTKFIFEKHSYLDAPVAMVLTIVIQFIISWIPPIIGTHFGAIFAIGTILLLIDYYKQKEANSFALVNIGALNFSSLFFSGIFVFTNLTLLLSIMMLLIFTKKPFINILRIYIIFILLGVISVTWYYDHFASIILVIVTIIFSIYSSASYYTNIKKTFEIEQSLFNNRGTILLTIFAIFALISTIGIITNPGKYTSVMEEYFVQWFNLSAGMFTIFIISLVISVGFGVYNIFTYHSNKSVISKISILFAIHWILFYNPLTIQFTSLIILESILWSQSLIYIIVMPIYVYGSILFLKKEIENHGKK